MIKSQQIPSKRGGKGNAAAGANGQMNPADLEGEELIDFLETKLEGIEKKLAFST